MMEMEMDVDVDGGGGGKSKRRLCDDDQEDYEDYEGANTVAVRKENTCDRCWERCGRHLNNEAVAPISLALVESLGSTRLGHWDCLFSMCSELLPPSRRDLHGRLALLVEQLSGLRPVYRESK